MVAKPAIGDPWWVVMVATEHPTVHLPPEPFRVPAKTAKAARQVVEAEMAFLQLAYRRVTEVVGDNEL